MNTQHLSSVALLSLIAFAGCSTSLPQKDRNPNLAKAHGYYVSADEAKARGGVGNFVPMICPDGGWGAPAADCTAPAPAPEPALHAMKKVSAPERPAAAPEALKPALLKVYFAIGKTTLDASETKKLEAWAKSFKERDGELMLRGFADPKGNAAANQKLSALRAEAVSQALLRNGIKAKKSEAAGLGAVEGATSAAAAKEARRVEIFLN